jgi:ABC-type bacteriocin/lantibiotic exporter with double-glycine peptidase domain
VINLNEKNVRINVPYYQQTKFSTCGAASLMMVIKYWDNKFELSKKNEYLIWMKSNPFIFLGGTLQFGLAKTAFKMGLKTNIIQKSKFSKIFTKNNKIIDIYEIIASYGARHNKIPIIYKKNIYEEIYKSLNEKIPPIVFINLKPLVGENVLHWLVVTGYDKNNIYVNDPYIPNESSKNKKKDYPIKINLFKKSISTDKKNGLRLPGCLLKIFK